MRLEFIRTMPREVELQLAPYAAQDYTAARSMGYRVVENSREAAIVWVGESPILVAGVQQHTLLGLAPFWFLLCNEFRVWHIKGARRLFDEWRGKYPTLCAEIECSYSRACKFAKLFGFAPTGRRYEHLGREFELYEVQ